MRTWPPWLVVGLLAIVGIYLVRCVLLFEQLNDDAFITFRYSRFLATGRGPYFNIGEHVEGYSNFLLMVAMAPVFWLGGENAVPPAAKSIGIACGVGCVLLAFSLSRRLLAGHPTLAPRAGLAGLGAAALVAASPAFAVNSTTGLETTLFAFLLILGVWLSIRAEARGAWCGAGVAYAALALTRPEGAYLFAFASFGLAAALVRLHEPGAAWFARPGVRRLVLDGVIVTAVVAAHLGFRWIFYDGEWLPNTYHAKSGGFWKIDAWSYIRSGLFAPFLGIAGIAVALPGAVLTARRLPESLALFAAALAGATLPFITGPDWMIGWRLTMPYVPLVACVVATGWATGIAWAVPGRVRWVPGAVLAAAAVAGAVQLPLDAEIREAVSIRAKGYAQGHRALADSICGGGAAPGERIALMDIGIVGYYCDESAILDISGLTDRFIAKSEGSFLRKKYDAAYVLDAEPRFVVLALTAKGWYFQPPPKGTRFNFWTRVERRLYRDERFKARYVRPEAADPESDDWLESLRRRMGAARIVEHAYPGRYYLLLIFESAAGS